MTFKVTRSNLVPMVYFVTVAACGFAVGASPIRSRRGIWTTSSSMPLALGEIASAVVDRELLVFGEGSDLTLSLSLDSSHSSEAPSWAASRARRPFPGHHHGLATLTGTLYLVGGFSATAGCHNPRTCRGQLQAYNVATDTWTVGPELPWDVEGSLAVAALDGRIFACGGLFEFGATAAASNPRNCGSYSPSYGTWDTSVTDMPVGVDHAAAGTDGSKMYIFGGRALGRNVPGAGLDIVQIYDPKANTWSGGRPMPFGRSGMGAAALITGGQLLVAGGETCIGEACSAAAATEERVFNQVFLYDPAKDLWTEAPELPTAVHGIFPTVDSTTGVVYLAGGGMKAGFSSSNILQIFSPDGIDPIVHVASDTGKDSCSDDQSWSAIYNGGSKTCKWVAAKPTRFRCNRKSTTGKLAREACRRSCGMCVPGAATINTPTEVETSAMNSIITTTTATTTTTTAATTTATTTTTATPAATASVTSIKNYPTSSTSLNSVSGTTKMQSISRKDCVTLGWSSSRYSKLNNVCASSKVPDCLSKLSHAEATAMCEAQGSRVCTVYELEQDVARGTGCMLDIHPVWAANTCGFAGHMVVGGSSKFEGETLCAEASGGTRAGVRCCADRIDQDVKASVSKTTKETSIARTALDLRSEHIIVTDTQSPTHTVTTTTTTTTTSSSSSLSSTITMSVPQSKVCVDSTRWTVVANGRSRTCSWVSMKPNAFRCRKTNSAGVSGSIACPLSCGTCLTTAHVSPKATPKATINVAPHATNWRWTANLPLDLLEAQGAAVGNALYVMGGFVAGYERMGNRMFSYRPDIDRWTELTPAPISGGITHCGQAVDKTTEKIYFVGGMQTSPGNVFPNSFSVATVLVYDTKMGAWDNLPNLPAARAGGGAAILGNKLYFFGGGTFLPHRMFVADHTDNWVLDLKNVADGWRSLAPLSKGRNHLGASSYGGKIYAIGGQLLELEKTDNQNLVEEYDPVTNKWTQSTPLPKPLGHITPGVISVENDGIYVVGGVSNGAKHGDRLSQTLAKLSFSPGLLLPTWKLLDGFVPHASQVAGVIDDKLHVQVGWQSYSGELSSIKVV